MRNLMLGISSRTGAAMLSLVVVICLIIIKVVVSIVSGSISISAQAADSILDIFSIVITFIALKRSIVPADEDHPFGHGKNEALAAIIQAALILGAGIFIIYSAIQRIIHSIPVEPDEGIGVMLISISASFFLSRHLRRVAQDTGSTALDALARNISADVYSAAGVMLGLMVVRFTGMMVLDPIIALVMAAFVLKAGYEVTMRAVDELSDHALPEEEQEFICNCLKEHNAEIVSFHALRSRRAGNERFIDLHIVMPRSCRIEAAHNMCDILEQDIKEKISNANIIIHVEPCHDGLCTECFFKDCDLRSGS